MKKGLFVLISTFLLVLPLTVDAAVSFNAFTSGSEVAIPSVSLDAAVTSAGTNGHVVISGESTDKYELNTDVFGYVFVIADTLEVEITSTVSVLAAGTLNNGKFTVTGEGSVSLFHLSNYICPLATCNFNTTAAGSAVSIRSIDATEATFTSKDTLLTYFGGGVAEVYTQFDIVGNVVLGQNLGLMGSDVLNIAEDAELVVPENIRLDNRNELNIAEDGTLTVSEHGALYNGATINNDGLIDVEGTAINGAIFTGGAVNREQEGSINVSDTGTIDVAGTFETSNITADVTLDGTLILGVAASITNPEYITMNEGAVLTNNTDTPITVSVVNEEGQTEDYEIPAETTFTNEIEEPNPQTSDNIIISIILGIISLLILVTTTYYLKNKKMFN